MSAAARRGAVGILAERRLSARLGKLPFPQVGAAVRARVAWALTINTNYVRRGVVEVTHELGELAEIAILEAPDVCREHFLNHRTVPEIARLTRSRERAVRGAIVRAWDADVRAADVRRYLRADGGAS